MQLLTELPLVRGSQRERAIEPGKLISQGSNFFIAIGRYNSIGKPEVFAYILEVNAHSDSGIGLKNVHQRV